MVKVYFEKDADLSVLNGRTVAVIGYGSQGSAQANCMKDSGVKVILGLREGGSSWERARNDGLEVYTIKEAAKRADIIHMLIPDTEQAEVYKRNIRRYMSANKTLCFSHGFNILYQTIKPPPDVDVIMVAPKAPGLSVREMYLKGFGVPALIAVNQDYTGKAKATALAIAKALGATKAGVIETTFKDETESDLIGEQTVLVGGIIELIRNGFEVLTESGYPPELAYFEACDEAKLIIDQIYRSGIVGMLKAVSDTAKYGGMTVGPKVIDSRVKRNMLKVVERVRSGAFAREWLRENRKGRPTFKKLMDEWANHPLEKTGAFIRTMSGLEKK
ncbi:MAG: ketol-acid reductoisomerase [Candidatus Bathyarchaeia archaeon]